MSTLLERSRRRVRLADAGFEDEEADVYRFAVAVAEALPGLRDALDRADADYEAIDDVDALRAMLDEVTA